jgi:hypothetical protein
VLTRRHRSATVPRSRACVRLRQNFDATGTRATLSEPQYRRLTGVDRFWCRSRRKPGTGCLIGRKKSSCAVSGPVVDLGPILHHRGLAASIHWTTVCTAVTCCAVHRAPSFYRGFPYSDGSVVCACRHAVHVHIRLLFKGRLEALVLVIWLELCPPATSLSVSCIPY